MTQDFVFFQKEGEAGVALTSTSANYTANLAKEYIQTLQSELDNTSFVNITVGLIGTKEQQLIAQGVDSLDDAQEKLVAIASAKSLIAWLREAIKAKEEILKEVRHYDCNDYCKINGFEPYVRPTKIESLTADEYYKSLPIKERNRYFELETQAAVIGNYIHPNGAMSVARKKLKEKLKKPFEVSGSGRDALIYSYTASVNSEKVDEIFFNLQNKHREIQAQLNSMKHSCDEAVSKSANEAHRLYEAALEDYNNKQSLRLESFDAWQRSLYQEYSKLKIVIPNSLLGIYNTISKLGK